MKKFEDDSLIVSMALPAAEPVFRIHAWTNWGTRVCVAMKATREEAEAFAARFIRYFDSPRTHWRRDEAGAIAISIDADFPRAAPPG